MKNIFSLLVFALLYACGDTPPKHSNQPRQLFRTTAPSRLYFKNMRSYYYNQDTKSDTRIDVYTLKAFSDDATHPILLPIIMDNWLEDEAYILLEQNAYPAWTDTLQLKWSDETQVKIITISTLTLAQHYELAKRLFDDLKQGHKIRYYTTTKEWKVLYANQTERANFLSVMKDYYNLTETSLK